MTTATRSTLEDAAAPRFRPPHVPPELIRSLDTFGDPRLKQAPFETLQALHGALPVYWNDIDPMFGKGFWVLTGADDMRAALEASDVFQSKNWVNFQRLVGESWPLIPNSLDGDVHMTFRAMMAPWFSPAVVKQLNDKLELRAEELIDRFAQDGRCDFVEAFSSPYPVTVLMELLGLPVERMPEFLSWEKDLLSGSDMKKTAETTGKVIAVLRELIEDRKRSPRDDLSTKVVQAEVGGRPITDDECLGILFALFLGGLDTVATSLGLFVHELAADQALQDRLRADASLIPAAVEELLRIFAPVTSRRRLARDVELHGAPMKAGDWVSFHTALGGRDPAAFPDPLKVDLDRTNRRHFAFVVGPHFCLGHHLARRELQVALKHLLDRLPSFRVEPGGVEFHGGVVFGVRKLQLVWG